MARSCGANGGWDPPYGWITTHSACSMSAAR